jgi:hypothetical protein
MSVDDDKGTNGGGVHDHSSGLRGSTDRMRAEIRKDLESRLAPRRGPAEQPATPPGNAGVGGVSYKATQTCPACGGSGDGVSGAACGCCGGRGWVGSD